MVKTKGFAFLVVSTFVLSGCTGLSGLTGCGEGYEEMYGGYDYVYDTNTYNRNGGYSHRYHCDCNYNDNCFS